VEEKNTASGRSSVVLTTTVSQDRRIVTKIFVKLTQIYENMFIVFRAEVENVR